MRNYQRKKNNPYELPQNVYMQMIYLVKDYERLIELEAELSSLASAPTDKKLSRTRAEIQAVDNAFSTVPELYRKAIADNIVKDIKFPSGSDVSALRMYKQKFVYEIAKQLSVW